MEEVGLSDGQGDVPLLHLRRKEAPQGARSPLAFRWRDMQQSPYFHKSYGAGSTEAHDRRELLPDDENCETQP